ncbi:hypothetical protein [Nocardia takedensis]|uniref:hypothetical protein n=1 Tax=Nocardia takedensis TaxID=259390 RepID=UPI0002EDA141|nr:hypothetical protein [Nocardia takedensis]
MSTAVVHLADTPPADDGRLDPDTMTVQTGRRALIRTQALVSGGEHAPLWAVLGAHGGAGASTLARWWAPAADTGPAWPASAASTQDVVIAARLCIPGLVAAAERLREWHAGLAPAGVRVIGLVLTAARPGTVPKAVRRYRSVIAELVREVHEIAWHDELLATELPDLAQFRPYDPAPPRRARLSEAVPTDVHRVGAAIFTHLAAAAAPIDTENLS